MRDFPVQSIDILGAEYKLFLLSYEDWSGFKDRNADAYVLFTEKEILVCDAMTHPKYNCTTIKSAKKCEAVWVRHEIIHAFLYESGLYSNSSLFEHGWAENEEMIDWFAIQSPKIFKIFNKVGVL